MSPARLFTDPVEASLSFSEFLPYAGPEVGMVSGGRCICSHCLRTDSSASLNSTPFDILFFFFFSVTRFSTKVTLHSLKVFWPSFKPTEV